MFTKNIGQFLKARVEFEQRKTKNHLFLETLFQMLRNGRRKRKQDFLTVDRVSILNGHFVQTNQFPILVTFSVNEPCYATTNVSSSVRYSSSMTTISMEYRQFKRWLVPMLSPSHVCLYLESNSFKIFTITQ